jgi:hypothetical protein
MFIATPHGGAYYARLLNAVLKALFSGKRFVEQLRPGCEFLEKLQEAFEEPAEEFQIVNYYESMSLPFFRV